VSLDLKFNRWKKFNGVNVEQVVLVALAGIWPTKVSFLLFIHLRYCGVVMVWLWHWNPDSKVTV